MRNHGLPNHKAAAAVAVAVAAAVTLSTVIHSLPHHGDAVVDAFKVGVILASYVMLCSSSS